MTDRRSKNLPHKTKALEQTATAENDGFVELSPTIESSEPCRTGVDRLKKIYRVPCAADLHPGLSGAEKPWPSPGWGVVTSDVLDLLHERGQLSWQKDSWLIQGIR